MKILQEYFIIIEFITFFCNLGDDIYFFYFKTVLINYFSYNLIDAVHANGDENPEKAVRNALKIIKKRNF